MKTPDEIPVDNDTKPDPRDVSRTKYELALHLRRENERDAQREQSREGGRRES